MRKKWIVQIHTTSGKSFICDPLFMDKNEEEDFLNQCRDIKNLESLRILRHGKILYFNPTNIETIELYSEK